MAVSSRQCKRNAYNPIFWKKKSEKNPTKQERKTEEKKERSELMLPWPWLSVHIRVFFKTFTIRLKNIEYFNLIVKFKMRRLYSDIILYDQQTSLNIAFNSFKFHVRTLSSTLVFFVHEIKQINLSHQPIFALGLITTIASIFTSSNASWKWVVNQRALRHLVTICNVSVFDVIRLTSIISATNRLC